MNLQDDYRQFLKDRFGVLREKNPRYSLRAFARDLEIPPGRLSEVLSQKAGLSAKSAEKIASKLGLSAKEKKFFINQVLSTDGRAKSSRISAAQQIKTLKEEYENYTQINLDQFKVISDWYHFAIIDLLKTNTFKNDMNWISKRLGISKIETELAIERMKKLNLIQSVKGRLQVKSSTVNTPTDISSEAIRKFHKQVLNKAILAIDFQTIEQRDFSAVTMPISTRLLPEVKQKIKEFRRALNDWIAANPAPKNEVYCLNVQFFKLTECKE